MNPRQPIGPRRSWWVPASSARNSWRMPAIGSDLSWPDPEGPTLAWHVPTSLAARTWRVPAVTNPGRWRGTVDPSGVVRAASGSPDGPAARSTWCAPTAGAPNPEETRAKLVGPVRQRGCIARDDDVVAEALRAWRLRTLTEALEAQPSCPPGRREPATPEGEPDAGDPADDPFVIGDAAWDALDGDDRTLIGGHPADTSDLADDHARSLGHDRDLGVTGPADGWPAHEWASEEWPTTGPQDVTIYGPDDLPPSSAPTLAPETFPPLHDPDDTVPEMGHHPDVDGRDEIGGITHLLDDGTHDLPEDDGAGIGDIGGHVDDRVHIELDQDELVADGDGIAAEEGIDQAWSPGTGPPPVEDSPPPLVWEASSPPEASAERIAPPYVDEVRTTGPRPALRGAVRGTEHGDRQRFLAEVRRRIAQAQAHGLAEPPTGDPAQAGVPEPVYTHVDVNDLVGSFVQAVEAVGGLCHHVTGDLPDSLLDLLVAELDVWKTVVSGDEEVRELAERLSHRGVDVTAATPEDAMAAGMGVTSAAAGIAATGALVLDSQRDKGRLAALLPPVHLCLLPVERLVATPSDVLRSLGHAPRPLPSSLMLLTGPSRGDDVEKLLSIGALGPAALHVVLLERNRDL